MMEYETRAEHGVTHYYDVVYGNGNKPVALILYEPNERADHKNTQPIPLTEEWLVRLGFEKDGDMYKLDKDGAGACDGFTITISSNGGAIIYPEIEGILSIPHIKYVHQLQNLFYCLVGEELILKQ